MVEYLLTMIIVIIYNFISLKPDFLCYYKSHLPKTSFAYSTWTSFRDPHFDFEFETIERFRFFYFILY